MLSLMMNKIVFFAPFLHADVRAIATGGYHSVVQKADNSVWTTGKNGFGELGDGKKTNRNTFVEVVEPSANACKCPNGSPKAGAACTKHGAAMCASCKGGFTINAGQTECAGASYMRYRYS
jgi:hypothetical protein